MSGLDLMIFTVGGVSIGVDARQVGMMITPEQAEEREIEVIPLHQAIPFRGNPVRYRSPKALLRKGRPSRALLIESPDDIVQAGDGVVHPLPAVLAACNTVRAIWGIAVYGDRVSVLIDLDKLDKIGPDDKNMAGGRDTDRQLEQKPQISATNREAMA